MKGLLTRHVSTRTHELLTHFPAVGIVGARQVGKSTLASMLTGSEGSSSRFLTLDDPEVRAAAEADPRGFLAQAPGDTLVVDEFQRVPALGLVLKAAIDSNRAPGRFLITGSANLTAKQEMADSLAGRLIMARVHGLSQGELGSEPDDFISAVVGGELNETYRSRLTRDDYVDRIVAGSYPEAVGLSPRLRAHWYDSYISLLLERDVRELARLSDPLRLRTLLTQVAATQGSETVITRLGGTANLPAATTSAYMDLLRALFLIDRIPPWTPNLLKREIGRSKYVLADTGLAVHLTRTRSATLKDLVAGSALGGFLEAFVAAELLRQQGWSEERFALSHYRSPDGREVDLIAELDEDRVIGIEVKAASSASLSDTRHLAWLRDQIGERFVAGIVLTTDERVRPMGKRIWSVPVSALWELG